MKITLEIDKLYNVETSIPINSIYDVALNINLYDSEMYDGKANQISIRFLDKKDFKSFVNMIKKQF